VLLAAAGSVVVVPASAVALPLLIGPGYGAVPWLLALLVPSVLAYGTFLGLTTYFSVQAVKPELMTVASLLMLGSTLVCMVALVPILGDAGAAVATSMGSILGASQLVRAFARLGGRSPSTLVPGRAELRDYAALGRAFRTRLGQRGAQARVEGV